MKTIMLAAIRIYRSWISPILPGSCRFAPTCSAYAHQALERHGAWQGALLTARRLLKCHPFHPGGHNPVPERTPHSKFKIQNSRKDTDHIWNVESEIWNSGEMNLTTQRIEHDG
jgi:putative membrane protein insertion efficiency factor